MDQAMHRLIRMVQISSRRGFYTHGRMGRLKGPNLHKRLFWAVPLGAAVSAVCGGALLTLQAEELKKTKRRQFSLSEFQAMCEEGRTVVAYQGELYDMSDFSGHPGGVGRLQMASGGDLEVYWKVYTQHNRGHVKTHMERYKIGEVSK